MNITRVIYDIWRSWRRCHAQFLRRRRRKPVPEPVAQAPQALITELPAGFHSVAERFSRADIHQHVDHRSAARPTAAPMKLASAAQELIARIPDPAKSSLGDLVDQQRARRILARRSRRTRFSRCRPWSRNTSAPARRWPRRRPAAARPTRSPRAARFCSNRRTKAASRGSDSSAVPSRALPTGLFQREKRFERLRGAIGRPVVHDIDGAERRQPVPVLPQLLAGRAGSLHAELRGSRRAARFRKASRARCRALASSCSIAG